MAKMQKTQLGGKFFTQHVDVPRGDIARNIPNSVNKDAVPSLAGPRTLTNLTHDAQSAGTSKILNRFGSTNTYTQKSGHAPDSTTTTPAWTIKPPMHTKKRDKQQEYFRSYLDSEVKMV